MRVRRLLRRTRRRLSPATIYGAGWAAVSVYRARHVLARDGLQARIAPPPLRWSAGDRGVHGVLSRLSPSCLERAVVLQTWMAAHRREVEIIIGVGADDDGETVAHAWIEGDRSARDSHRYQEIHRIAPPGVRRY